MTDALDDDGRLRRQLVAELAARGDLDDDWADAFATVPRHAFLPEVTWHTEPSSGALQARNRDADPQRWLVAAYRNEFVVTQVDDGTPRGPGGAGLVSTSSASMPTVVARMLAALDVHGGERVLEIGTGTGYNAALLAHRLGAGNVTTVEIDPAVADAARHSLRHAGYGEVAVVTADGEQGYPAAAPYDRIISTAACEQVPVAWVRQARPGGKILTPWANDYFPGGLLSLSCVDDDRATGRIVDRAWFMSLRTQRRPRSTVADVVRGDYYGADSTTTIHPYELVGDRGASLAISLRVPSCRHRFFPYDPADGAGELWFLDSASGSWARHVHHTPDATDDKFGVRQHGPRRLWDEIRAAHEHWNETGRPGEHDWEFTVIPAGTKIGLSAATGMETVYTR